MRVPLGSTRAKMISLLWLISWDQVINPRRVTRTYTSPSRSCLLKGGGLTSLSVLRLEAWVTTTGSSREKWEGCAWSVLAGVFPKRYPVCWDIPTKTTLAFMVLCCIWGGKRFLEIKEDWNIQIKDQSGGTFGPSGAPTPICPTFYRLQHQPHRWSEKWLRVRVIDVRSSWEMLPGFRQAGEIKISLTLCCDSKLMLCLLLFPFNFISIIFLPPDSLHEWIVDMNE